mgnify:CR=1 FL=1|jgi:hypothetical protein
MKLSDSKTPGLFSTYSYSLRQILTEKLCTPFEYPKVKLEIKLKDNLYIQLVRILDKEINTRE